MEKILKGTIEIVVDENTSIEDVKRAIYHQDEHIQDFLSDCGNGYFGFNKLELYEES